MLTKEQAPWIEYLELDEDTGERRLSSNTPEEVKKAYEEHQQKLQEYIKDGKKIPK